MKKLYSTLLILGLSVCTYSQSWMDLNLMSNDKMNTIGFADDDATGWVFGDSSITGIFQYGVIYKTNNQGYTWQEQNMGTDSIQILACQVFSNTDVIAVGKYQTAGDGAVITTSNGGLTWDLDTTSIPERLFDLDFASPSSGYIVGRNGYVGKSTNGGSSFTSQTSGTSEDLFAVSFSSATDGWCVGADGGSGGAIVHTPDGGATWNTETTTSTGDLFGVFAINADSAVAVGAGGLILTTYDAGTTWNASTSGTAEDLFDVAFEDNANGRAVGAGGTILITTDAGQSWNPETSNTTNDLNDIYLGSNNIHWNCGTAGDAYIYSTIAPNSIDESTLLDHKIYPNPVEEDFRIEVELNSNMDIYVYSLDGQLVLQELKLQPFSTVNVSELNAGMYTYVILTEENAVATGKFIKK